MELNYRLSKLCIIKKDGVHLFINQYNVLYR